MNWLLALVVGMILAAAGVAVALGWFGVEPDVGKAVACLCGSIFFFEASFLPPR